jgi:hypothetical protein
MARFRRSGLFFLSPIVIDKISEFIPVNGEGLLNLSYEPALGCAFHLQGSLIKQGDSTEHFAFLKGRKLGKKWLIDQLQWDDWSLYAELHQASDRWEIPFLGMKGGDALLLGLKGDLWNEEALLKAQLNFCEVDLSKLDFFASMRPFMAKWSPKGNLHATGELEWNLLAKTPSEGCKVVLEAEVTNFHIRDFPIERFVEAKQQDHLKGTLAIEQSLSNQRLTRLELDDGLYIYKGRQYDLKQLKFQVEENAFEFSAMTQQERYPFQVIGHFYRNK